MEKVKIQKSWISKKLLLRMTILWLAFELIAGVSYKFPVVTIISGIIGMIIFIMLIYFIYAYYVLSPQGGDLQSKISGVVAGKIDENSSGKLLDIGCGCGILSVELAVKCPNLNIQGIDYWSSIWCYSKEKCEQLAKDYNVSERVSFLKASASALPFDDETFDIVISNMVFHKVAGAQDKREVIKEALRVLKKGGQFVFQDLLLKKKLYGTTDDLVQYIKNTGVESVSFNRLSEEITVPALLNNAMFFGDTAMLSGKK